MHPHGTIILLSTLIMGRTNATIQQCTQYYDGMTQSTYLYSTEYPIDDFYIKLDVTEPGLR